MLFTMKLKKYNTVMAPWMFGKIQKDLTLHGKLWCHWGVDTKTWLWWHGAFIVIQVYFPTWRSLHQNIWRNKEANKPETTYDFLRHTQEIQLLLTGWWGLWKSRDCKAIIFKKLNYHFLFLPDIYFLIIWKFCNNFKLNYTYLIGFLQSTSIQ